MIENNLSFFAQLYGVGTNDYGMNLLFITIYLLCVLVYKLGFAKKLPLFKSIIIYVIMFLFTPILTFMGAFSPVQNGVGIAEGLVMAVLFLGIYKIRLYYAKRTEQEVKG